jgi:antitoxin component of MazEF toxin-antitoxin module
VPYSVRALRLDLPFRDIRVYTQGMRIVKVRRVGNSNVVSIPREFEANGFTPGSSVLVEELPGGELRILPTERLREQIRQIGRRVVTDHDEALRILAEHDPDSSR